MAGNLTYLHGTHQSSIGCIVEPVSIELAKSEIEKALDRELTDVEVFTINENLSIYSSLRLEHFNDSITSQSIKRTLAGISKLNGKEAEAAYNDCDAKSNELILKALYYHGARGDTLQAPSGNSISKAAMHALNNLPSKSGAPRKVYQKLLAKYVVSCWQALGRTDNKVYAKNNFEMSPLASFGVALFSIVENDKFDATGVAKLLRVALNHNASTR